MIKFFGTVFILLFIGEIIVKITGMLIPAAVIGLILLLGILIFRNRNAGETGRNADRLLRHMSLLYIPAGAGVMVKIDVITNDWQTLVAVILAGTIFTQFLLAIMLNIWMKRIESKRHGSRY